MPTVILAGNSFLFWPFHFDYGYTDPEEQDSSECVRETVLRLDRVDVRLSKHSLLPKK